MTQDANPQSRPLPKALLIVMPSSAALLALYNVLPFVEPWSWLPDLPAGLSRTAQPSHGARQQEGPG